MEQKRTLWIILASGIFLLVVIGAAVILYAPAMNRNTNARALRDNGEIWVAPGLSSAQNNYTPPSVSSDLTLPGKEDSSSVTQGLSTPLEGSGSDLDLLASQNFYDPTAKDSQASPSVPQDSSLSAQNSSVGEVPSVAQTDSLTVIANGTTNVIAGTTTIDLNSLKNYVPSVSGNVTAANEAAEKAMQETEKAYRVEEKSVIEKTVQSSQIASVTESNASSLTKTASVASAPKASTSSAKASSSSSAPKSAASAKSTATSAKSNATAKASSSSSAKTVSASTATPDRFWVQAASFSTKKKADEARATLDENKIQCEVFTYKDDKGNLFYRVRVGPYTTKSEAEYWKKRIDAIPEFATSGSYVTNSTAKAK